MVNVIHYGSTLIRDGWKMLNVDSFHFKLSTQKDHPWEISSRLMAVLTMSLNLMLWC